MAGAAVTVAERGWEAASRCSAGMLRVRAAAAGSGLWMGRGGVMARCDGGVGM